MQKELKTIPKIVYFCAVIFCLSNLSISGMWWQRSSQGSTWQDWYFDDADDPALPEKWFNPQGIARANIFVSGKKQAGWCAEFMGRNGVWQGDFASVTLQVANDKLDGCKEIWMEIGLRGIGGNLQTWIEDVPQKDISMLNDPVLEAAGKGWQTLTVGWKIAQGWSGSEIEINFVKEGIDLDYITVDTFCMPEPACTALLFLGGLLLLKRRK